MQAFEKRSSLKEVIFVFQQWISLSCLSPQFACYFLLITAPFNNMWTLTRIQNSTDKYVSSTVNQMFGGSSELSKTAKCTINI